MPMSLALGAPRRITSGPFRGWYVQVWTLGAKADPKRCLRFSLKPDPLADIRWRLYACQGFPQAGMIVDFERIDVRRKRRRGRK